MVSSLWNHGERKQESMRIIINADDFGLNENCTQAIAEAFSRNLITSTTMCGNGAAFDLAVRLAREHELTEKIGVHLNITEGTPLTKEIQRIPLFCDANGQFRRGSYRWLKGNEKKALFEELDAQINRIQKAGIPITHIDSHHHIHTNPFLLPIAAAVAKKHQIRSMRLHRNVGPMGSIKRIVFTAINWTIQNGYGFYTADFFSSAPSVIPLLDSMAQDVVVEIMVHPKYDDAGRLFDERVDAQAQIFLEEISNRIMEKMGAAQLVHYELGKSNR